MRYIKNLERNQYWKKNKFGYTSDLNEAGLFNTEEVIEICRDANILGKVNDVALTAEDIVYGEENMTIPNKTYSKRDIDDVMSDITEKSLHETNPISHVMNTLITNEYYPTSEHDNLRNFGEHIGYNETFEKNIQIEGEKDLFVKMSIYRMDSGKYELTAYKNYNKPKKKRKNNARP